MFKNYAASAIRHPARSAAATACTCLRWCAADPRIRWPMPCRAAPQILSIYWRAFLRIPGIVETPSIAFWFAPPCEQSLERRPIAATIAQ